MGRRGSSLNSNATKNLLCVQSVHSPRFEERMPNTKEMRYQDPSVTDTLQTAGNTEVRYLLMGPEHSSYIRVQLFQHLRVAVSPSSLSPPPPPTDLNIGVESAPLEGHMWPHSQLIRRVQFFFYAECSHVSGQNRNCKCGPKLCCGGWLDLSHTKQVKTTRGNQMLWFYGLKDILQCVKRKLCSQQVTHGPPGAKHRTGR